MKFNRLEEYLVAAVSKTVEIKGSWILLVDFIAAFLSG
jgi:hypothetical protein